MRSGEKKNFMLTVAIYQCKKPIPIPKNPNLLGLETN